MESKQLWMRIKEPIDLYELRNAIYMRGDTPKDFLDDAFWNLSTLGQKSPNDKEMMTRALASVFARTCAFENTFKLGDMGVVNAYCSKFPFDRCTYCHQKIEDGCKCTWYRDRSIKPTRAEPSPEQLQWTFQQFMEHNEIMYGSKNRAVGLQATIDRLGQEINEAKRVLFIDSRSLEVPQQEIRRRIAFEFADIRAWTFSVANVIRLEPQKFEMELESRYAGNCHRCNMRPCMCGCYHLHPRDGVRAAVSSGIPIAETRTLDTHTT